MKFIYDHVVVKFDRMFNYETEIHGENGKMVMLAIAERPEMYVNNEGTVIGVPDKLSSDKVFAFNKMGPPLYYKSSPQEVVWLDEVPMDIEVGDKVYCHHNAVMNAMKDSEDVILKEEFNQETKETVVWLKVLVTDIFCSERNGELFPNATWVLVEPDMETWEDILVPIPEIDPLTGRQKIVITKKLINGIMKTIQEPKWIPKDKWIQTKQAPEAKLLKGFIHAVGDPLKGDERDLKKGDHIIFRNLADFEVEIGDKKYYLMKQRNIRGVIEK
jgi:co-chaperonin GroES (HSP10)